MPLAKVNDILKHATENKYGVAAINTLNFESIQAAVLAAEKEKVPVIIQYYPGLASHCPLSHIAFMAKEIAGRAAVPVAVHLDHSATYEIAVSGIRDGFPSIMVDGSARPFEENVALTKSVVDIAVIFGLDVEAELGHVGSAANLDDFQNADHYTNVEQAVEFVEKIGCHSLAVAVGNAHGDYKAKPNLDFDRIAALRKALGIPLVLHGCSGIPDEQMQEAVNRGMSKFNVATEYFKAMYAAAYGVMQQTGENGDGFSLISGMIEPMSEFVREKIRLLNPNHFSLT